MYSPLAGFVQDRAVSIYGTQLTASILNQIMEHAARKEVTELADACLFHEKQRPYVELRQELKDQYKQVIASKDLLLLY